MPNTFFVDAKGLLCPKPLVEARKKLIKMDYGDILEILIDHDISRKELPLAMKESGNTVLEILDLPEGGWKIIIEKTGE